MLGYVYFVEAIDRDAVKIGYSKSPWARVDNMRTSSPVGLRVLWLFKGTRELERHLHYHFQNHRLGGEWFQLSAVRAGFWYYGLDPESLLVPKKRGLRVSGELPSALLPRGVRPDGPTEVELRAARKAEEKRLLARQRLVRDRGSAKRPRQRKKPSRAISVGEVFGWLTVIAIEGGAHLCRCRCGFVLTKRATTLLNGDALSCAECRGAFARSATSVTG